MNLNFGELPLGDTNAFRWLLWFFFLQVLLPSEKISSWWGVNMSIVNSIGHKRNCTKCFRLSVFPGMAQIKFTRFTGTFLLLLHVPLLLDSLMCLTFLSQFCGLMEYFSCHHTDNVFSDSFLFLFFSEIFFCNFCLTILSNETTQDRKRLKFTPIMPTLRP